MPVCALAENQLEVGNLYGSGMGCHGNLLVRTSVGAGEAEIQRYKA